MTIVFEYDSPGNDVEALRRAISNKLVFSVGKDPDSAQPKDWFSATFLAVRDRMVESWMRSTRAQYSQDSRRVYYLSMEFLMGRALSNALISLDLLDTVRVALDEMGVNLDEIMDSEPDAALGNGGLGRLAACFLDSMAGLGLPGMGYGIRYDYGMFKQNILDGQQMETPDYWLSAFNVTEFPREEVYYVIRFGGRLETENGKTLWVDTQDVRAIAYDYIIPGYQNGVANTLRLWSAKAGREINLTKFNQGDYFAAVEDKNQSENVSRVLYPDDSTYGGRELRLRQEYFFISASLRDILHRYFLTHETLEQLPEKVAIHLNDTHPVLAVPELMRILIDECRVDWDTAWAYTQRIFSYTNHTLMGEALETWPLDMFGRLLPRHLQIIFEINEGFLKQAARSVPGDADFIRRVSLIDEGGERKVRMAWIAVVASHTVNGVSALHSELMRQSLFKDFYRLYPERFTNVTNGITPRRWLA